MTATRRRRRGAAGAVGAYNALTEEVRRRGGRGRAGAPGSGGVALAGMDNSEIADMLGEVADLLEGKGGNAYRVGSYRRAAETVAGADRPVAEIAAEAGEAGLKELPGIGEKLAGSIREIVESGRFGLLERLRSEVSPEEVLAGVPGMGETLARRVHEELGVDSLEGLERAAHDGRLESVEGVGPEKARGIRDALAGMLSRSARRRGRARGGGGEAGGEADAPGVEVILDVDAEYRRKAGAGELRTIAPKRFNPEGKSWLAVLDTKRNGWTFTALYSNTARAHELGKTDDWVVIYHEREGRKGRNTVVTGTRGKLKGRRVVRGREADCRAHYGL